MNNIIIKGRLTRSPELKTTNTGKEVANLSVAVPRRFSKDEVDFFNVRAWGKTGVFVNTYFTKGQEILISGSMQSRKWCGDDGTNHIAWELVADEVEFCGSKSDNRQAADFPEAPAADGIPDGFTEASGIDNDLPF